jgi:hypothetical protein
MGGWLSAFEARAILARGTHFASPRRRWAVEHLVGAGTDQLIDGQVVRSQQPGRAACDNSIKLWAVCSVNKASLRSNSAALARVKQV